jgi:hypothetical protein
MQEDKEIKRILQENLNYISSENFNSEVLQSLSHAKTSQQKVYGISDHLMILFAVVSLFILSIYSLAFMDENVLQQIYFLIEPLKVILMISCLLPALFFLSYMIPKYGLGTRFSR